MRLKGFIFLLSLSFMSSSSYVLAEDGVPEANIPSPPPQVDPPNETTVIKHDPRVPAYQRIKPKWGVHFLGSLAALGKPKLIGVTGKSKIRAFTMQIDYQPQFLQSYGVFGIGPSFGFYPVIPKSGAAPGYVSNWSIGGQARYQARFFREQPLVPVVAYEVERLKYSLNGKNSALISHGVVFGGMLLLNLFDKSSAADFYAIHGVVRSYAVAELRTFSGSGSGLSLSGRSVYFGVRCEL